MCKYKIEEKKIPKNIIIYRWKDENEFETGLVAARLLYITLEKSSYVDHINIIYPGSELQEEVKQKIVETKLVILLLTPNCFERCVEEDDFFAWEILTAFKEKAKIIPVMFYDSIPPSIPNNISHSLSSVLNFILKKHAIEFVKMESFSDSILKIKRVLTDDT